MKNVSVIKKGLALAAAFFLVLVQSFGQAPFKRGVNVSGWFQAPSARQIQFTKYTRKDFEQIKSLGCDVIRLPINLHAMTTGPTGDRLDPLFLNMLDQVVDWSEDLGLHLILDNHTFDPAVDTNPNIGPVLVRVWTQMATHFKDRSEKVYYEILNEPHGISDQAWGQIQGSVIAAIRTVDTRHTLIVGGAGWNGYQNLQQMPVYQDPKLLYTFHFYDPFLFTHQGASWNTPSMAPLAGVPFPYRANAMPAIPTSFQGTWVEGSMRNYSNEGTVAKVKELIDVAVAFRNQRQVPVFCGEFGVYIPNSAPADRVFWYEQVRQYFEAKDIPWTIWDYRGGFGLFEPNSNEFFEHDLNIPLLRALDLNVPDQTPFVPSPKKTGFQIYDDFFGPGLENASWTTQGDLDFYANTAPQKGLHAIHWAGVNQYDAITFQFKPTVDFSFLASQEHTLSFWVKGQDPTARIDLRFVDTKTGPEDRPWRYGTTLDQSKVPFDGNWHQVEIPFSAMREMGSYDNGWYPPANQFDWTAVSQLQIVAEHHALAGSGFWFDEIKVEAASSPTGILNKEYSMIPLQVYPNPLRATGTIRYHLPLASAVNLSVYDVTGKMVAELFSGEVAAGKHELPYPSGTNQGAALPAGFYLLKLTVPGSQTVRKILVQPQDS